MRLVSGLTRYTSGDCNDLTKMESDVPGFYTRNQTRNETTEVRPQQPKNNCPSICH